MYAYHSTTSSEQIRTSVANAKGLKTKGLKAKGLKVKGLKAKWLKAKGLKAKELKGEEVKSEGVRVKRLLARNHIYEVNLTRIIAKYC